MLLGGVATRNPKGALMGFSLGGLLGSVSSDERPLALETALRRLAKDEDVEFVSFQRIGTHGGKVSVRKGEVYRLLTATADEGVKSREEIDDVLYEDLKRQIAI
jgi:hypothetical protein